MSRFILRAQNQLLTDVRRRMRDPAAIRWSDQEIYMVLSDALMQWYDRVAVPQVYTITGGWVTGQSEYELPSYIRGDVQPQQRRHTDSYLYQFQVPTDQDQWVNVNNYHVWPNESGGLTLHWGRAPDAGDGRVLWWGRNGRLPLTVPTLVTSIDADDTSAIIYTSEDLPVAGYIKIGEEWIAYNGITDSGDSGQKILNNLTRDVQTGLYVEDFGHTSGSNVYWGVAVHRDDLYTQLYDAARSELHALYLTAAAESERAHHERMSMYYGDKAMSYWTGYIPNKRTAINLSRGVSGDLGSENYYQVTI